MSQNDCGAIPVVEDEQSRHLCGMITDRDIAVRGVARGRGADTRVSDLMTHDVECCPIDADLEEVERVMTERQVRRVPIIDAEGVLVGIIAQADLVRGEDGAESSRVIERISEPGRNIRSAQGD
jgi:CBS domain-containing protein